MWKYNSVTGKWEWIAQDAGSKQYNKLLTDQPVINDDSNLVDTMQRVFQRKKVLSDPSLDQDTRKQLEEEQLFDPYTYQTEESNKESLIKGKPENEQYFKYLEKAENRFDKSFLNKENPYLTIAKDQGFGEQFGRKMGNLLPNIALGIIESIGYLGELPGAITGSDRDFSNSITEWAKAGRNDVFGEVYQMHPEKTMDLSDSAWWLNNGVDLVESIAEFAVPGMGIGKGLGAISKGLSTAMKLGKTGSQILNVGLAQIPTSAALAYTEGAMSGADVYSQVYEDTIRRTGNEQYAKDQASNSAATTVALNTAINTALNLYSVGAMFTNPTKSSLLSKQFGFGKLANESIDDYAKRLATLSNEYVPSKMASFKKYLAEAPMESAEELVNVFSEKRGRAEGGIGKKQGWVDDLIDAAQSDEGMLSMALGALGGIGNIAVMNNLPNIKANEQGGVKLGPSARQEEVNQKKAIYAAQLNALKGDLNDFFANKEELQNAVDTGNRSKIKEVKEKLFNIGLNRAIVEGNADSMISTLQEIAAVDNNNVGEDGKTDAMRQGLTESTLDNSYKEIAQRKIERVKRLAEEFKGIEEAYTPKELEAPGFIRHVSRANVNYVSAQDNLSDAVTAHNESLGKLTALKEKLQATELGISMAEGAVGFVGDEKETLKKMAVVKKQFNDSKEMQEFKQSKENLEKAQESYNTAKEEYNKAHDFKSYKDSLTAAIEKIDEKKGESKAEEVVEAANKQELDNKFANAGYTRTGKVGESFIFNKEGKDYIAERVSTAEGQKVLIKDPQTGKYLTDKGKQVEFNLEYYSNNRDISIIPKQQFFEQRKADILKRSKEAQLSAIESVINDYQDKIQAINDSIPKYQESIKELNNELSILQKDMEKLLQKNRQSKLSKKAIKERIKQINKVISETESRIEAARTSRDNIQNSIDTLKQFDYQLRQIPDNQMISLTALLKDTQFALDSSTKSTQDELQTIAKGLEDIIFNLTAERDRLRDIADALEELLATDELFASIETKNIKVATFLDKYPEFPAKLLEDTTKLLDSGLNKLAVINYIKRIAAGQNQPFKVVKQQMIDDMAPLADEELTASERQVIENYLQSTLSELSDVNSKLKTYLNQYLNAKEKARDIRELQNQFDVLSKHITALSTRYSKELSKDEKGQGQNVDKTQQAGTEEEIVPISEVREKTASDSFLSDFVFYTTGRNLKFDETGTLYDGDGNPIFDEGYQQRWFKFLDKHSNEVNPSEDNPSEFSMKVFVRGAKNTPKELNKLMDEEVGSAVTKNAPDVAVFLVDSKGEYVKLDDKGNRSTNGIPAFRFLPQLDSLLPTDKEPKVTWRAIASLYQTINGGSLPSINNKKDDDVINFQSREMTVREYKDIILNEARTYYGNFIDKIANTQDGNLELEIGSVTNGISLRKKDKDGNSRVQSLADLLKSTNTEIKQIYISKFGAATVIKGLSYQYDPGTVIVELTNGAVFPVHTTTLNKDDIDTALYLIAQGKFSFGNEIPLGSFIDKEGKKVEKFTLNKQKKIRIFPKNRSEKYSLLGNLLNWGKYNNDAKNKNFEIYIDRGYVHFKDVTNNFAPIRLPLDEVLNNNMNGKLKDFLAEKRYNVSSAAVNSKSRYFHPFVKDGKIEFKEYNSYEDYLLGKLKTFTFATKDGQMMASKNIVIATDGKGFPIIKNTKIETTQDKAVEPEEEEYTGVEPTEEMTAGLAAFGLTYAKPSKEEETKKVEEKQDEADELMEKIKRSSKRVSLKNSVDNINMPVEDPYYGLGKEKWESLSEEEQREVKWQKDNCKNI